MKTTADGATGNQKQSRVAQLFTLPGGLLHLPYPSPPFKEQCNVSMQKTCHPISNRSINYNIDYFNDSITARAYKSSVCIW